MHGLKHLSHFRVFSCFLTNLFREFSFFVGVRYGSHCGSSICSVWADKNGEN